MDLTFYIVLGKAEEYSTLLFDLLKLQLVSCDHYLEVTISLNLKWKKVRHLLDQLLIT